jgi:hypothetical protein
MSFADEFYEALNKKKKKKEDEKNSKKIEKVLSQRTPYENEYYAAMRGDPFDDDIAPVRNDIASRIYEPFADAKEKLREQRELKDALLDGEDTISNTYFKKAEGKWYDKILGTVADAGENLWAGIVEAPEKIWDAMLTAGTKMNESSMMQAAQSEMMLNVIRGKEDEGVLGRYMQAQDEAERATAEYVAKDLWSGEEIAKKTVGDPLRRRGIDTEANSVLGEKSEALVQSAGQFAPSIGISMIPGVGAGLATAYTGATAFGSEAESAFREGATFDETVLSSTIAATAEILTEKFGGMVFGGKSFTDEMFEEFSSKVTGKLARRLLSTGKLLASGTAEGVEEWVTELATSVGKKLTYMDEKEFGEIFTKEAALDAFLGGFVFGEVFEGGKSVVTGRDPASGLTKSEQAVVDKVSEDIIKQQEADGKTLTNREKSQIQKDVVDRLEKGQIDVDTIESTLGGDKYKAYTEQVKNEESLKTELDELRKIKAGDRNDIQTDRMNELKGMNLDDTTKRDALRKELDKELSGKLKHSLLNESYKERARKGEAFNDDLSQYTGKRRESVERAIKSGVLNNTYRSHELVKTCSWLEAEKGITFDYTNNAKLKESGFAVEGKTVNGYVNKGAVTLNVQSAKAWQSVVGHEIGHVLKGGVDANVYTELQNVLYEYAQSKGELDSRRAYLTEMYKGMDADIEEELTSDLLGDYLFTDKAFINKLTGNRTLFQKIYDEVKYLCKRATGKELTEIEKVKREFDKAWEQMKVDPEGVEEITYSMSGINAKTANQSRLDKAIALESDGKSTSEEIRHKTGWFRGYDGKWRFEIDDSNSEFMLPKMIEAAKTKAQAKVDKIKADYKAGKIGKTAYENKIYSAKHHADPSFLMRDFVRGEYTLGQILKHPKLYAAYPELKNVVVRFERLRDGVLGSTSDAYSTIRLHENSYYRPDKTKEILIHEIQHQIQEIEGFASGASPAFWETQREYIKGTIKGARENLDLWLDDIGYSDFVKSSIQEVAEKKKTIEQHWKDLEEFKANSKYAKQIAACEAELEKYQQRYDEITNGMSAFEQYQNTAGEIEARDVENRLNLDAEQRKNIRPDIDRENVVFADAKYSVSPEADSKYMSAVERGDTETAQRMVDEAAKNAGYDYHLYHGTNADFTKFDLRKFGGANGKGEGYGIYLAANREISAPYGKNIIDSYTQFKRLAEGSEKTLTYNELKKIVQKSCELEAERMVEDGEYDSTAEAIKDTWISNYVYTYNYRNISQAYTDVANTIWSSNNNDGDIINEIMAASGAHYDYDNAIDFYDSVLTPVTGIDGFHYIWGKSDGSGVQNDIYLAFHSEQVKSADPVTYDDKGNVIPLSQRFNAENEDIRYSLSNEGEEFAPVGNYSTPFRELALGEDIAPVAPTTEMQSNVTEEAPMPNEIRPMTEDEANAIQDAKAKSDAAAEGLPKTRKQLHNTIINDIKATFNSSGHELDDVLSKAKDLSTFSTVDNTPQRVMEKALGYKEGQILSDLTVNKVAQNETKGIKWLNSFTDRKNGLLAQISKQYRIKPGSKESAAAQMYAEGFFVNDNNDIVAYGDAELAQDFPDKGTQYRIKGLAHDPRIRQIYDETLDAINKSRARNAYPEIQKLDNYFLHFRAMDDTFSKLGLPFNPNDIRAKDLPTDLNGVTADLKPGQPYFASAMHRTGKRTSFDLLGGLERYLTSAKNQIYHIDDIQTLRALRNYIADTYGQANGLERIDVLSEEEAQERIEQVYNSHLSTFAKFLNEEANVLAGKTALIDRGLEGFIGRRGMTFLDTVNRQVGSNMVGFNFSSSMTNFLSVAQGFAKTNKFDFTKAFAQTVANKFGSVFGKSDGFTENSPVVIRRKGVDRFYRTPFQKAGDAGYVLMSAVDNISTELIARTKFNEFTRKGMDEQTAHFETDKWVSRLMGDRSLGQQPQLYNSKTLGILTKFQLEVRNQLDSQFYDTIQEAKVSNEDIENALARNAKTAAKVTSTFVQLAVAQHLFGKAFESIAGYNPAFDIISVLSTMFGFDDDEESEDTVLDNIEQGFLELLEDLPYTSTLTGGRIPLANALPVTELIKGVDSYGNEKSRWETLGEAAPYYVLPGGYSQLKKTVQGLNMFSDKHPISGSYTKTDAFEDGYQFGDVTKTILGTSTKGGNLRFPVEDTLGNRVQAALFGQYASENAREYFDNGYAPLKEKQIQEYIDVDMPIKDYWEYREGLKKQETLEDKFDYIAGLDLPVSKKNILINNVVDRKEPVDLDGYEDFSDYEEFDFATKNPEKWDFLQANNISYDEYNASKESREAYNWAYKNPEGYAVSKIVADDVVTYRQYTSDLDDIHGDKDAYGKTIKDSRKAKVIDYINNLDADYYTKIILYKSQYIGDDSYNADIVNYIVNRSDLTYDDRVAILTELGFRVAANGDIYAD